MALHAIEWNPTRSQLRIFAFTGTAVLGLLGVWAWTRQAIFGVGLSAATAEILAGMLWGVAAALAVMAIAYPPLLRPLHVAVSIVTFPVGFVMSHVLLALVFYLVLTPVALVMRLLGRDTLSRRFEPEAESYWQPAETPTDPKRYFRQF
jgi:hypothetical protein